MRKLALLPWMLVAALAAAAHPRCRVWVAPPRPVVLYRPAPCWEARPRIVLRERPDWDDEVVLRERPVYGPAYGGEALVVSGARRPRFHFWVNF